MNRLLVLILSLLTLPAAAVPLDTIGTFCGTFPAQCQKGTESLLAARGTGTNAYYVLEVDPTTGSLPVNVTGGSFSISVASDGPTGSAVPAQASYQGLNNGGTLIGAVGDSSGRQVVVGAGTAGTSTGGVLSVQGVSGGTAVPISAASLPLPTGAATETTLSALNTKVNSGYGLATGAIRVAAQIGVGTTVASVSNPLPSTITDLIGNSVSLENFSGTQFTTVNAGFAARSESFTLGWDGSAHREIAVDTSGNLKSGGRTYADSVRYAYSSGAVGTSTWVQLIASTASAINCIQLFDSSGQTLELGTGAAASETRKLIIPPGGLDGCVPLAIPSATRVSIRALSATTGTVGEIDITGLF